MQIFIKMLFCRFQSELWKSFRENWIKFFGEFTLNSLIYPNDEIEPKLY